ncbi:Predicted peroxiredoxin [gamma proteobacterium HdN1]|nr:Predicted peroxiredoxin [gamma proteobacterium HdN1]
MASKALSGLKVGDRAPSFSLLDQNGTTVSLADCAGKPVVVYFYPKAMTPGCTIQACGIRDHEAELRVLGVKVLAISPDLPERLKRFDDKEALNFTLLSDPDHAIAEAYGVWALKKFMGREFMGIVRTTFVVDADGKIAHVLDKVKTKTHAADVLALLAESKNLARSKR